MTDHTEAQAALAEIVAGLDGVTQDCPYKSGYSGNVKASGAGLCPICRAGWDSPCRLSPPRQGVVVTDPDTIRKIAAAMAAKDAEIRRLRDWLVSVDQYGRDTLSGTSIANHKNVMAKWYAHGVSEMVKRSQHGLYTTDWFSDYLLPEQGAALGYQNTPHGDKS